MRSNQKNVCGCCYCSFYKINIGSHAGWAIVLWVLSGIWLRISFRHQHNPRAISLNFPRHKCKQLGQETERAWTLASRSGDCRLSCCRPVRLPCCRCKAFAEPVVMVKKGCRLAGASLRGSARILHRTPVDPQARFSRGSLTWTSLRDLANLKGHPDL